MKKICLLFCFLISIGAMAQTPIITAIVDGDCTGGTPKMLEIYANGTVDFSLYALENQTNANTSWGVNTPLTSFGIVTDDFVYVSTAADLTILNQEFPSTVGKQVLVSSVINLNGDDRIRIVQGITVIDQFGVSGVDGSATTWETTDSYAKRLDGTGPDGGFTEANWNIPGPASLDLQGVCQGGTAFETLMGGIGTFSPSVSIDPAINITSPANGTTFAPGTPNVNATLSVQNFTVATPSAGDGFIKYTVDSGAPVDKFDTNAISLVLASGAHTVVVELVDNAGASLSPAATSTVNFTIADFVNITDIATLRTQPTGATNFYKLSGEAILTFQVASRNQKFLQDATGAILVDDQPGTVTTLYEQGDGISGFKGTLTTFAGVLEFVPFENTNAATSNDNSINNQVVTIDMLNTNVDAFESEIVRLENVTFVEGDGLATFAGSTNYNITDGVNTMRFRTQYPESGLNGTVIPTTPQTMDVIVSENNGVAQVIPFFIDPVSGFTLSEKDFSFGTASFKVYPNPVSTGIVNIVSPQNGSKTVAVFDILGKQMLRTQLNGTTLDVSQLNNGIYILKIEEDGKTTSKKLIVQK